VVGIKNSTKIWYYNDMGNKHKKIFLVIFERPDRKDIDWDDFVNLLIYLGVVMKNQGESAHGISLNGEYSVFHKPHPGHTIYPSELKRIRKFFTVAGVENME
jgi:hypothetical protein